LDGLVKLSMICYLTRSLSHVLERVKLKYYIGRICFYPTTHMICPTGSVAPVAVSSIVWWKKLLGKLKQQSIVKSFDMYACKIQDWKFASVLTTAYPADSRKAYCKVCNSAINNILLRTHGPYHRHKSTKSG